MYLSELTVEAIEYVTGLVNVEPPPIMVFPAVSVKVVEEDEEDEDDEEELAAPPPIDTVGRVLGFLYPGLGPPSSGIRRGIFVVSLKIK